MSNRIERRRHVRYYFPLSIHVPASLRVAGDEYLGKIINLSNGGFLMATERLAPEACRVQWDIQFHGCDFQGAGRSDLRHDGQVAVTLDDSSSLSPLLEKLSSGHNLGAIERRSGTARVKGYLGFNAARNLLHQIRAGNTEIDLSECDDVDSADLGVLLIAHREQVRLRGCHGKVLQIVSMVGMCNGCFVDRACPGQTSGCPV